MSRKKEKIKIKDVESFFIDDVLSDVKKRMKKEKENKRLKKKDNE